MGFLPAAPAFLRFFFAAFSYKDAMTSTSHRTFLGSVFTATQERAGLDTKYLPYTSLNAAKSPMSARKQVVFTTFSKLLPAASKTAPRFLHTRSACAAMSPPTSKQHISCYYSL